MDFIYDDGSKDLSLQSLTTTILIQKILENEGILQYCARDQDAIASRAIKVVNNLPLPSLLKWQLRRMVLPIMEEMQSWYRFKDKKFQSRVVLTQNGTVDLPKSIKSVLNNENVSLMHRFELACEHCLEHEIFDFGAQITFSHNLCRPESDTSRYDNLAEIWFKTYEDNFYAKLSRKDISEYNCTQGFYYAFYRGNSAVVKYFLEEDSPCKISDHILYRIDSTLNAISFTPDACIKMFKTLNEEARQRMKSIFSAALLKALLRWPYQHQFLKAAESLAKNMDKEHFLKVAARIVEKARYNWEDHDYKSLLIDFWNLGSEPKTSYNQPAGYASRKYAWNLLYDVILMRDERLANFVLDNTTEEFKTQHLFNFCDESVCLRLIFEKHFEALELFMEVCRVNNDTFILQFQKDILEYLGNNVSLCNFYIPSVAHLENEKRKNILREFLSRMDKLKPKMSEISI